MRNKITKILITGQSGILGSDLVPQLDGKYEIIAASRHPRDIPNLSKTTNISIDISQVGKFKKFLDNSNFDIIINCAAMTDVDRCESDRESAFRTNAHAPDTIAHHCAKTGALLVHVSTDYLFDGKAGPYPENSIPNPINYYGATKLMAENVIRNSGCDHIIVRTSFLYGRGAGGGSRVVRWILDSYHDKKQINVAIDQFSNPTYSANLAAIIDELLRSDFRGVINVAGADYLSRYEFALAVAQAFGLDKSLLNKVPFNQSGLAAPRPLRAGLKIDLMGTLFRSKPMGVREGLGMLRQSFGSAAITQTGL